MACVTSCALTFALASLLPHHAMPMSAVGLDVEGDMDQVALLQMGVRMTARSEAQQQQLQGRDSDGCDESDPDCVPMMAEAPAGAPVAGDQPSTAALAASLPPLSRGSSWGEAADASALPSYSEAAQPPSQGLALVDSGAEAPQVATKPRLVGLQAEAGKVEVEDMGTVDSTVELAAPATSGGAIVAPHCTPTCNWACDHPKCDEECAPTCKPPICETRCGEADLGGCKMACDQPHCSVVCPKFISELPSKPCTTQCSQAMCALKCDNRKQPCRNVCEQPRCEWKCKAPTSCPAPKCKMVCQSPASCSGHATLEKLPPLRVGEVAVQAFEAPASLARGATSRSRPTAPPATLRVPVRSLVQAEPDAEPEPREWQVDFPLH